MSAQKTFLIRAFRVVAIAIVVTMLIRLELSQRYIDSSLFYFLSPFLIGMALYWTAPAMDKDKEYRLPFWEHFWDCVFVFLLVSAFMLEGFICVLFTAPLYFIATTVSWYAGAAISRAISTRRQRHRAFGLPILVAFLSLEGASAATTFDRDNHVVYELTVSASIDDLKRNMAKPISFDQPRHWFISVFPKPVKVEAGSLEVGDIHRVEFVYNKWFVANPHKGEMQVLIASLGEDFVETKIVDNSSYLASYMAIDGTRVQFAEVGPDQTKIALTVFYRRKLDPVWYFAPLQYAAMRMSAKYLIESVIARERLDG